MRQSLDFSGERLNSIDSRSSIEDGIPYEQQINEKPDLVFQLLSSVSSFSQVGTSIMSV